MVKKLAALIVMLLIASPVFAGRSMIGRVWNATSNFTAVDLTSTTEHVNFDWTYGLKIIVYGSADDSITVTVMAADGLTTLFAGTTTSATSTEKLNMAVTPIPPGATIAVSDIGSGTANIIFVAATD